MSLRKIKQLRNIEDDDSEHWASGYRHNIQVLNPEVSPSILNILVKQRVQDRGKDRAKRRERRLGTPPAFNPKAILNLPIQVRNIHSNNSPEWASIIRERELKRNPYLQSNRLDGLIANQVQAAYVGREMRQQQRQLEKAYQTRKSPRKSPRKSLKTPKPKSVKRKQGFFGKLFGK